MRLPVRFAAVGLAASLVVLAACSGDTATPASPDLAAGSLTYAITPSSTGWSQVVGASVPKETRTVLITGLIAVGGYPTFGTPVFTGGPSTWLNIDTRPNLSRSPLGWLVSFKLTPAAGALPQGEYRATIPVTVPGATNNPQSITVTFGCTVLRVGDMCDGGLTAADPRWNWSNTYNTSGNYPYDDYTIIVPAFTTVSVIVEGIDCLGAPYTHEDNTLTVWDLPGLINGNSNDDGFCGNDPIVVITNATGATREYRARASSFDEAFYGGRDFGTYRIRVALGNLGGGGGSLRADDSTTPKVKQVFTRAK